MELLWARPPQPEGLPNGAETNFLNQPICGKSFRESCCIILEALRGILRGEVFWAFFPKQSDWKNPVAKHAKDCRLKTTKQ